MALLVIAYPQIDSTAFDWIQNYRKDHDKQFKIIIPHFTLVFPISNILESEFIAEIQNKAKGFEKIEFELKNAVLNKDPLSSIYHEFLVPEKGYEKITKLHDLLYSEKLRTNLRLDISFIPHVTIGDSLSFNESEARIINLNSRGIKVGGLIDQLTIIRFENYTIESLQTLDLT